VIPIAIRNARATEKDFRGGLPRSPTATLLTIDQLERDLSRVSRTEFDFVTAIARLDDRQMAQMSLLPGWTVGHVLSHVARNADSHARRSEAAERGEIIEQYPGGFEGRALEIEAGAKRPADEIIADVARSSDELLTTWQNLPDVAWDRPVRAVSGQERPLRDLPARRWQELWIHLIDLGTGPTILDWPDEFVDDRLAALRLTLPERLPAGSELPTPLTEREELAWLFGRPPRQELPQLSSWE
jgi:maleylpyruvate isomerase